jgi:hypothetical protein
MSRTKNLGKRPESICRVRLDRALFVGSLVHGELPHLSDYQIESDHTLRPQAALLAYRRLRKLKNRKTTAITGIQYGRVCPWLRQAKVTVTSGEQHELSFTELKQLFAAFEEPRLLQFELAFDFPPSSGVNRKFVRAHGVFGKCRPVGGNFYSTLNYGGRKNAKFIRAYDKPELNCYRVELQFNSAWLRRHNIRQPKHLCKLADEILRSHFSFVEVNWERLESHLYKTNRVRAKEIVEQAHKRSHVLHRTLNYLRVEAELQNAHRFLKPLKINREIKRSLRVWSEQWGCRNAFESR